MTIIFKNKYWTDCYLPLDKSVKELALFLWNTEKVELTNRKENKASTACRPRMVIASTDISKAMKVLALMTRYERRSLKGDKGDGC